MRVNHSHSVFLVIQHACDYPFNPERPLFSPSFGLRYLFANLGELQADAVIREFIITQRPLDIVERLLG